MPNNESVLVQRANVVLHISPQQVDYYINQGYNIINERGEVIQSSVPKDIGVLQKAFVEHTAEIERLKSEIEELKKKPAKQTRAKKQIEE